MYMLRHKDADNNKFLIGTMPVKLNAESILDALGYIPWGKVGGYIVEVPATGERYEARDWIANQIRGRNQRYVHFVR